MITNSSPEDLYGLFLQSSEVADRARPTATSLQCLDNATAALRDLIDFVVAYRQCHSLSANENVCSGERHWHWWIMAERLLLDLRSLVSHAICDPLKPTTYAEVNQIEEHILGILYGPWHDAAPQKASELLWRAHRRWWTLFARTTPPLPPKDVPAVEVAVPLGEKTGGQPTKKNKGKNIDARMLKVLSENYEAAYWSAAKWALQLKCAESTVKETTTWTKNIPKMRQMSAAEAVVGMDRSRLVSADRPNRVRDDD